MSAAVIDWLRNSHGGAKQENRNNAGYAQQDESQSRRPANNRAAGRRRALNESPRPTRNRSSATASNPRKIRQSRSVLEWIPDAARPGAKKDRKFKLPNGSGVPWARPAACDPPALLITVILLTSMGAPQLQVHFTPGSCRGI